MKPTLREILEEKTSPKMDALKTLGVISVIPNLLYRAHEQIHAATAELLGLTVEDRAFFSAEMPKISSLPGQELGVVAQLLAPHLLLGTLGFCLLKDCYKNTRSTLEKVIMLEDAKNSGVKLGNGYALQKRLFLKFLCQTAQAGIYTVTTNPLVQAVLDALGFREGSLLPPAPNSYTIMAPRRIADFSLATKMLSEYSSTHAHELANYLDQLPEPVQILSLAAGVTLTAFIAYKGGDKVSRKVKDTFAYLKNRIAGTPIPSR